MWDYFPAHNCKILELFIPHQHGCCFVLYPHSKQGSLIQSSNPDMHILYVGINVKVYLYIHISIMSLFYNAINTSIQGKSSIIFSYALFCNVLKVFCWGLFSLISTFCFVFLCTLFNNSLNEQRKWPIWTRRLRLCRVWFCVLPKYWDSFFFFLFQTQRTVPLV